MQLLLQNNARELCALVWGFDSCGVFVFVFFSSISNLVFTNILRKGKQDFQAAGFVWCSFPTREHKIQFSCISSCNWENAFLPMSLKRALFWKILLNWRCNHFPVILSGGHTCGFSLPAWVLAFDFSSLRVMTRQREIPMVHCPLGHLRVLQILGSQILEWMYKDCSGLKILMDKLDLEIKPFACLLVSVTCIAAFGSSLTSACTSFCLRLNSCPEQASICVGRRFGEPQIGILFPLVLVLWCW